MHRHHALRCRLLAALITVWTLCIYAPPSVPAQQQEEADAALPSAEQFRPADYRGKNLLLLMYSMNDPRAAEAVSLMNDMHHIRREYNFEVVGICLDAGKAREAALYNEAHKVAFPVFIDHHRKLARRFRMRGGLGLYIIDKQGKVIAKKWGFSTPYQVSLTANWGAYASRYLSIPYIPADQPVLGSKPPAPHFKATALDGRLLDSAEIYAQKPVVLVIFSPSCINCKNELEFLQGIYTEGELKGAFEIVAISLFGEKESAQFAAEHAFEFPVIADPARKIQSLFPSFLGPVPVSFIVDRQGLIRSLHTGFSDHMPDIYRMELKAMLGLANPPLLVAKGYSTEQRCGICHEKQHNQWSLTRHADAFLSLVRKGREEDVQCVSCHVTGFGQEGGYSLTQPKQSKHLRGVQCEACHGPGYESCSAYTGTKPPQKKGAEWKQLCLTCHTDKESLNFVFAKRYPRVVHDNAPDLTALSRQERIALLRTHREKNNLFDNPARYVGAETCRECHQQQYEHWLQTAHARAHETEVALAAAPDKIFRYHTGVGGDGGYPEPGRQGVQCEACHGPGERHIAEPDIKGDSYIVGLGKECASCVVEQICRRCHGLEDDPDFEFGKAIGGIRHPNKPNDSKPPEQPAGTP